MYLNPNDFALAVGVKYGTLRAHINRKKVFKSGDYIDTDFELNKLYINEKTNGKGLNLTSIDQAKKKDVSDIVVKKKDAPSSMAIAPVDELPKEPKTNREDIIHNSLNLRKKKADAEKSESDSELKKLELAKKMGELMPIDLAASIFQINIQTVFRTLENESENIASIYCEILGGDRSHLSEMVRQMREAIQRSVADAKEKSADEIKSVIKEYALVRSGGERK